MFGKIGVSVMSIMMMAFQCKQSELCKELPLLMVHLKD